MQRFPLKTLTLAVAAALALAACGHGEGGGGGPKLSVSAETSDTTRAGTSSDNSESHSFSTSGSAKAATTVSAVLMLSNGAKPLFIADNVKLYEAYAHNVIYMGEPLERTTKRLKALGFGPEDHQDAPASTPEQVKAAKAMLATLANAKEEGMTKAMHTKLKGCLETVVGGDANGGKACLAEYYIREYALAGAMIDTYPQPTPEFDSEEQQKFSNERINFPKGQLETYATSGKVVANLSMKLKAEVTDVPPGVVMRDDEETYDVMVDKLYELPLAELRQLMARPAKPLKLGVDFQVIRGEANSGLKIRYNDNGMLLVADEKGWSIFMNGGPYHGGDSGLLAGGRREFAIESSAVASHELRTNDSGQNGGEVAGSTKAGTSLE